jgi:hypothetical protein
MSTHHHFFEPLTSLLTTRQPAPTSLPTTFWTAKNILADFDMKQMETGHSNFNDDSKFALCLVNSLVDKR